METMGILWNRQTNVVMHVSMWGLALSSGLHLLHRAWRLRSWAYHDQAHSELKS